MKIKFHFCVSEEKFEIAGAELITRFLFETLLSNLRINFSARQFSAGDYAVESEIQRYQSHSFDEGSQIIEGSVVEKRDTRKMLSYNG